MDYVINHWQLITGLVDVLLANVIREGTARNAAKL
jgi:hypothetical protein